MSRFLIAVGVVLVLAGIVWAWLPRAFGWFGHLPGDLRFETKSGAVFVPLASMLVVSVAGSLLLNGFAWLLRRLP